ncbi:MAG: hypothetical protein Q9179_002388 [Wetmoreana sp. 5 TL-2023]
MASNTACLRVLRHQAYCTPSRQHWSKTCTRIAKSIRNHRAFSITPSISAAQAVPETAPPSSAKSPEPPRKGPKHISPSVKLAAEVHKRAPTVTEPYIAYTVCGKLIKECAAQADYTIPQRYEKDGVIPKGPDGEEYGVGKGWWYEDLGLKATFNNWTQITFLHMYILTVRLRAFPPSHAPVWHQQLLDHFFYSAEDRMVREHNIAARSIRNNYLKDLFVQWRGLLAGYDEGLVKGDAVLAAAVWRNVFAAREDVDFRGLGQVVSYLRGVLKGLEGMGDEEIAKGDIVFGNPSSQRKLVEEKSGMMDTLPKVEDVEKMK